MWTAIVFIHLFLGVDSWVNDYDKPFTFTCPQHQSIHRVVSHHENGPEDRVFDFQCSPYAANSESCFWSGYVNNFDKPVAFQCPNGGVLDGVSSVHDNGAEDRRFRFYCCEKPGMCLYNCFYSGWVNSYDGDLDYTVPAGHVMRGWVSVHDNGPEYVALCTSRDLETSFSANIHKIYLTSDIRLKSLVSQARIERLV